MTNKSVGLGQLWEPHTERQKAVGTVGASTLGELHVQAHLGNLLTQQDPVSK